MGLGHERAGFLRPALALPEPPQAQSAAQLHGAGAVAPGELQGRLEPALGRGLPVSLGQPFRALRVEQDLSLQAVDLLAPDRHAARLDEAQALLQRPPGVARTLAPEQDLGVQAEVVAHVAPAPLLDRPLRAVEIAQLAGRPVRRRYLEVRPGEEERSPPGPLRETQLHGEVVHLAGHPPHGLRVVQRLGEHGGVGAGEGQRERGAGPAGERHGPLAPLPRSLALAPVPEGRRAEGQGHHPQVRAGAGAERVVVRQRELERSLQFGDGLGVVGVVEMVDAESEPGDGEEAGTLFALGDPQQALGEPQGLRQVAEDDVVGVEPVQGPEALLGLGETVRQHLRPGVGLLDLRVRVPSRGDDRRRAEILDAELPAVALRAFGQAREQPQGPVQVGERLQAGRPAAGETAGAHPGVEGRLGQVRLGVVMGEDLGCGLRGRGETARQRLGDLPVDLLALALEQRLVRRVLDESVLEQVPRLAAKALAIDELRLHQAPQLLLQRGLVVGADGRQQLEGEDAADHRRDLGHLLGRPQPVEPRGQRIAQRRRQLLPLAGLVRLHHGLGQLFEEQGDAVRPRHDLPADLGRQGLLAHHPVDERRGLRFAERRQGDLGQVGARPPEGFERVEAQGQEQEERSARHLHDQPVEPAEGRGIEPVEVFDQQDEGLALGDLHHQGDQRLQRPLPLPLRGERGGGMALVERQVEQRGEERHGLGEPDVRQRLGEPVQRRGPFPLEEDLPQQRHDRLQGRALGVRRAEAGQPLGRALQALAQPEHQARFADPGFAADQHHLPVALARQGPAAQQQLHLPLAVDQGEEVRGAVLRRLHGLQHPVEDHRGGEPRHADRRQGFEREALLDQRAGGRAHQHAAGLGPRLQLDRQVESRSQGHRLLALRRHRHHGRPGVHAGAEPQDGRPPQVGVGAHPRHLLHQLEGGADGAPGIVLMGLGIAEIDAHPRPALEAAEVAVVALRHLRRQGAEPVHQLVEGLGIERLRRAGGSRRAHQLAAHHRHLPALAGRMEAGGFAAAARLRRGLGREPLGDRPVDDRALLFDLPSPRGLPSGGLSPGPADVPPLSSRREVRGLQSGQVLDHLPGARGPLVGVLAQQPVDQVGEGPRSLRPDPRHRRRLEVADPGQRLGRRLAAKGRHAGEHLVEERAQGEEVRAVVERQSLELLRGHGMTGPEDHPGLREVRVGLVLDELGEPEVEDLGVPGRRHHDVARLQVAVDDPLGMGLGEPFGDLPAEADGLRQVEAAVADPLEEGRALDQLHDDPVPGLGLDDVVDVDDGRVVEPGGGLRLAPEPPGGGRVPLARQEVLDGQRTLKRLVEGAVDDPHAAGAETLLNPVAGDLPGKIEALSGLVWFHERILAQAGRRCQSRGGGAPPRGRLEIRAVVDRRRPEAAADVSPLSLRPQPLWTIGYGCRVSRRRGGRRGGRAC